MNPNRYSSYQSSLVSVPAASHPTPAASATTVNVDRRSGTWAAGSVSFAGYRVEEVLVGQNGTVAGRTNAATGSHAARGVSATAVTEPVDAGGFAMT